MLCRLYDLKHKEVINSKNGCRIGYIDDLEIDTANACINAIVIYGGFRFLGFIGRKNDCVITWDKIQLIGQDTILVDCTYTGRKRGKKPLFFKKFQNP